MTHNAVIRCAWDPDAGVWFVRETDIPGLVTEAPTLDALRAKVSGMVLDLLDSEGRIDVEVVGSAWPIADRGDRPATPPTVP